MNEGDARSVRARVGGCLELEFRDLEGLDGLDTRFTRRGAASRGRRIYPVRCARKAATVPNLRQGCHEELRERLKKKLVK